MAPSPATATIRRRWQLPQTLPDLGSQELHVHPAGRPVAVVEGLHLIGEVLARARVEIEELSETAAELRAPVPAQVSAGIREAIEAEVLPVARHIAEVRGLSTQLVRPLERPQPANGFLRVSEQPGLGLTLDREALERLEASARKSARKLAKRESRRQMREERRASRRAPPARDRRESTRCHRQGLSRGTH